MQAEIIYTADTGEKLVNETFGPNNIRRRTSGTRRHERSNSRRPPAGELSLDRNGFVLVEHRTAVRNFFDADELKRVYYPEVEALIKRVRARRAPWFSTTRCARATKRSARRS